MKKLLFVLFAVTAAMAVIGLTIAFTRSVESETEETTEQAAA
jgi:flagellar basal body-associated protein FliL